VTVPPIWSAAGDLKSNGEVMRYAGGSVLNATLRTPAGDIPVLVDVVEVVDIRHGFPDRGGRLWSTALPWNFSADTALQLLLPDGRAETIRILDRSRQLHTGEDAEIFTEASFVDERQYRRGDEHPYAGC